MKNLARAFAVFAALALGLVSRPARARVHFDSKAGEWGAGIYLAAPGSAAVTLKYWTDYAHAWDAEIGGYLNYMNSGASALNLDLTYLWHRYYIFGGRDELGYNMPLYYGVGGALEVVNAGGYSGLGAGLRGVIGITYLFQAPFDVFAEFAPVLGVVPGVGLGWNLGLGGRFYFGGR